MTHSSHGIEPGTQICFKHAAAFAEPVGPGDAIRWVGPGVWRVEEVSEERVTLRLWPNDEPYPAHITEVGPGEWPQAAA
jgi:hypothetical protein